MTEASTSFPGLVETFPGNLASFARENLQHTDEGARLVIDTIEGGRRPYRSGAFASVRSFRHGHFEAEIRAAPGSGLITGFFLHRDTPRQEIDIEFAGDDPRRMLANVYFNPGDHGTAMGFGYRGSPCRIDLGFVRDRYARLNVPIGEMPPGVGDVLVVDTYDPSTRFRWSHHPGPALRVLLDDDATASIPPGYGCLWNPGATAHPGLYPSFDGTVLAGVEYLAIREDLPTWRPNRDGDILVSLGGGQPSATVALAFGLLDELSTRFRFAYTGDWGPARWRRLRPERFWAEAAVARHMITAAGVTAWEAAAVGIPVVLLMTAANQRYTYRWGRDAGVPGLNALLVDAEFLAHQLAALIEVPAVLPRVTSGAGRMVEALTQLAGCDGVT